MVVAWLVQCERLARNHLAPEQDTPTPASIESETGLRYCVVTKNSIKNEMGNLLRRWYRTLKP